MAEVIDMSCLPCCNKQCCGGRAALGDTLFATLAGDVYNETVQLDWNGSAWFGMTAGSPQTDLSLFCTDSVWALRSELCGDDAGTLTMKMCDPLLLQGEMHWNGASLPFGGTCPAGVDTVDITL